MKKINQKIGDLVEINIKPITGRMGYITKIYDDRSITVHVFRIDGENDEWNNVPLDGLDYSILSHVSENI